MSVGCPIRASFVYPFFHFTEIIVRLFHPYNFIWTRSSHRKGILESSFGLAFITTKEVEPVLPFVHVWNIQLCLSFFANLLNISHLFEYGFLKKPFSLDSFERSRFPTLNLVIINVFYLFGKFLTLNSDNQYVSLCRSLPSVFLFSKLTSRRISQSLSRIFQDRGLSPFFGHFLIIMSKNTTTRQWKTSAIHIPRGWNFS